MNINVNPDKLMSFAAYVGEFSKTIGRECADLEAKTARLASDMNPEDVNDILGMTRRIVRIVEDVQPDLGELKDRVETYASAVYRLQTVLRNN